MNVSERAKPYRKQRGRNCNSVRILHESSASHSRQEIRNKQQKNSIEITIALRSSNLLLHAAKKKEFEEKRKKIDTFAALRITSARQRKKLAQCLCLMLRIMMRSGRYIYKAFCCIVWMPQNRKIVVSTAKYLNHLASD